MDPMVKLAASALPNEKKYVLFAGAGVSKDAGVHSAWDLMLETASLLYANEENNEEEVDLEKWFIDSEYSQMGYSELIGSLYSTSTEQQSFLNKYLNGHKIGDVHKSIAKLAKLGIIRCIITTNFDHYIEKALGEEGIPFQVITEVDLNSSEPLIQCKSVRIYKPNGTLGKGALRNTPKDLEKLSEEMENELIRVISEHGVIVLGYSGRDPNMQKVFEKANFNHYPIFWVDPNLPYEDMQKILQTKDNYHYIGCQGANQFIDDYFHILERLNNISPKLISGPTIIELKNAFSSLNISKAPLYQDFLANTFTELKKGEPDFSEFDNYDDAVVKQIENSKIISYNFIEAALLACKYRDEESIFTIYEFFGNLMNFHHEENHSAYDFLIYEFFVSFIAGLIKYNHWDLIGNILSKDLFVEKSYTEKYLKYNHISRYIRVLDDIRNKRLSSRRISIMADIIHDRFNNTELSELITHKQFMEADYYLFIRSICENDDDTRFDYWGPRSCVYIEEKAPTYIEMAQRKPILEKLSESVGIEDPNVFINRLESRHMEFRKFYNVFEADSPLIFFDFNKLGSRE